MRNKRLISGVLALTLSLGTLTGCSSGASRAVTDDDNVNVKAKASDVQKVESLSLADIASSYSETDKESMVYNYVASSVHIDEESLIALDADTQAKETESINHVIEAVNESLKTGEESSVIETGLLNYMLLKFANTPFTWEIDSVDVLGMDAQTRLYFVDVSYKTLAGEVNHKSLVPDSIIIRGADDEESRAQKRYTDYIVWIEDQIKGSNRWETQVLEELKNADAASVLLNGTKESATVVMEGYEEDLEQEDVDERLLEEDALIRQYVSYTTDEFGVETRQFNYTFEDRWGSIDQIMETQNGVTLMERVANKSYAYAAEQQEQWANQQIEPEYVDPDDPLAALAGLTTPATPEIKTLDSIGAYTYTGLTQVAASYGATMTFRFILKEAYDVGLNDRMSVRALYLKDYELNDKDKLIEEYKTETIVNGDVLKPYVERLVKSVRKAIDETNHVGLYQLFFAYGKYDSYFADLSEYAYITSGGFHVDMIGRKGNEIACIVTQNTKERAKGTNMTMPTYQEEYLMKIKLCDDDQLRVVSMTPLTVHITGEPLSVVRDVKGISDQISYNEGDFTERNQAAVEQVIQKFAEIELNWSGDFPATAWDTIDSSISNTSKAGFKDSFDAISALSPTKSVTWLTGYATKSNLYVTAKLREVIVGASENYTIESELGIIYRNSEWKVVSYIRTLAVKGTQNSNVSTKDCLVLVDKANNSSQLFSWVPDVSYDNSDIGGVNTDGINTDDGFTDDAYTETTTMPVETDSEGNPIETEAQAETQGGQEPETTSPPDNLLAE